MKDTTTQAKLMLYDVQARLEIGPVVTFAASGLTKVFLSSDAKTALVDGSAYSPSFVVDVSSHHEAKMRALAAYHSQFIAGRPETPPTFLDEVRDQARYWGWTIGAQFGEPFLCREEVGLRSLRDLL